jgi:hypothetical protein
MANLAADVANQALDAIGMKFTIGDLQEGTRPAQVLLRAYSQCLQQLFRAANWNFARKTADLVLLADATGQSPEAGTVVPVPWVFEYEYPIDCMRARYIPWNRSGEISPSPPGNISIPQTPIVANLGQNPGVGQRIRPARFQVAFDSNYPPQLGQIWWETQGVSPIGRTVILTNVKHAQLVYTCFIEYPSVWDSLFRAAFVAYLGSECAFALHDDPKLGMATRNTQIQIVKQKLIEARLNDGNESTSSSDISVDWMRARNVGGGTWGGPWGGGGGGGDGGWGSGSGWDGLALADGSVF